MPIKPRNLFVLPEARVLALEQGILFWVRAFLTRVSFLGRQP